MIQIAYVSSTVPPLTGPQIADLLIKSRSSNGAAGITGILIYKHGNVLQVLEGEEVAVTELFDRIRTDRRHRGVTLLFSRHLESPDYPDWKMAFRDLNSRECAALEGVGEMADPDFDMLALKPSYAAHLLRKFRAAEPVA
jgi:FAD-dependent sensor of blue light